MKLGYSILFSVIIFLSGSKNLLFIMDYNMNRNFYESVCENKGKPEMHCHGKCQLTKDAQKTSKTFGISNLGFDFHFNVLQNIPELKKHAEVLLSQQVSHEPVPFWNEISIGVPNPPPNLNFN